MNRRNFLKTIGIASAGTLAGCEKLNFEFIWELPMMSFSVKKGEHYYEGPKLIPTDENFLKYAVMFPESQIYNPLEQKNTGWNKVIGMSRKLFEDHQENSARFVSRCDNENNNLVLKLGTYTYSDGKIIKDNWKQPIETGVWYGIGIKDTGKEYKYYLKNNIENTFKEPFRENDLVQIDPHENHSSKVKRLLPPYFGSKDPAPHDMSIHFINLGYFI